MSTKKSRRLQVPWDSSLGQALRFIEQTSMEVEERQAQADPKRHKLSRIMERGKSLSYRYVPAGRNGRGSKVWFCYACNRNVAGYYLCWRQIETKDAVKRDQWDATPFKKDAIDLARRRARTYAECYR